MKKITILIDQFYKHGGIEKLVAIKANYWATKLMHQVSILSTENKNNKLIYDLDKSISFKDLNINFNRNVSYFFPKNLLLFVKNLYKIQSHIIKEKPDFIIVASHIPITYILPFLYKRKTKIIKEIHYTQFYRIKREKNLKQKFFKYVESKYNALIVLSQEEKSFYKTKNVVVIPNPTIISLKPKNIVKKDNIATTIARFAPVKRLELLIDIWKELIKKQVNWQLHIYGNADNDYGKKIKDLIDKSQLQESVILKGMTNQVNEVLNKSKVSLLVSEQECFPMIILESFAVGVPVISFDCPTGPRNIITDKKDGLLIENNQIDDFVSIFEKFSKDLSLQKSLSANALLSADKYKVEKVMNEWQTKIFN